MKKSLRLPGLTTPTLRCPNSSTLPSAASFRHRRLPGSRTPPPINVTVTPEKPITLLSAACSLQAWRVSPTGPRQPITSAKPCISSSPQSKYPICTSCSPPKRSPCENSLPRSIVPGSIDAHSAARLPSLPAVRHGSLPLAAGWPSRNQVSDPICGSVESGRSRTRFRSDARPNGPRLRSRGENPDRKDVDGGVDIPLRDWSAGSATVGLRPARRVPEAANAAPLRCGLRVRLHEVSTGPCCHALGLCPQEPIPLGSTCVSLPGTGTHAPCENRNCASCRPRPQAPRRSTCSAGWGAGLKPRQLASVPHQRCRDRSGSLWRNRT